MPQPPQRHLHRGEATPTVTASYPQVYVPESKKQGGLTEKVIYLRGKESRGALSALLATHPAHELRRAPPEPFASIMEFIAGGTWLSPAGTRATNDPFGNINVRLSRHGGRVGPNRAGLY